VQATEDAFNNLVSSIRSVPSDGLGPVATNLTTLEQQATTLADDVKSSQC
jgi:hypothetical protein